MSSIPKLSASEVSARMGRMNPRQATSFYNRCMVNPDTPQENILLLRQYREQNPDRFLSDEQMRSSMQASGSTGSGGRGGWFRERGHHVVDGDGFSYDRDRVLSAYLRYKTNLRNEGLNILDFALVIPLTVSVLELGLPDNGDLIMDGPFDEPNQKFLRRQDIAYGIS